MTRVGVITNPKSRKNQRQSGREATLRRIVGDEGLVRQTAAVNELEPVVAELLDHGVEYLVSDGELFSGLEYLEVTRGPKVTVPTLVG